MIRKSGHYSKIIRSAFVLNSENLGQRVVHGASFIFIGIVLRTLLTLGSMSILARLLSPSDFGYIAMAVVVTELAGLFGGFGFTNILIQQRVINRLQIDTLFWASAAIGLLLGGVVFCLSYPAAWFYNDPLTGKLLKVMCIPFLINGLTNVHEAIIARLLRFKTEFYIQLFHLAVRAIAAIAFAYLGFGVWSLVIGPLVGTLVSFTCYVIAVPYVPRLRFHAAYLSSNWKTSGSYFSSGLLYYINTNIDLFMIGRSLGANALGYYQNARSLTDEIRARIAMPLQRVLFPAFSAIQSERSRLQQSVMRSGRLLAAIIIPVGVGLSAVSEELVPVIYGDKWLAMIPVLSLFGLGAAYRGSTAIASPLFNSQNRVSLALKYNTIGTVLMVLGVLMTLPYGIVAVSTAVALSSLYSLVTFRVGLGLIGLTTHHALAILGRPSVSAAVMWSAIYLLRPFSKPWVPNLALLLIVHIGFGAVIYVLILHGLSKQYFRDFREVAKKLLPKL